MMKTASQARMTVPVASVGERLKPLWSSRRAFVTVLLVVDVSAILLSFVLAYELRFEWSDPSEALIQPLDNYVPMSLWTALVATALFNISHLYEHPRRTGLGQQAYAILAGLSASVLAVMALAFVIKGYILSRLFFVLGWTIAIPLVLSLRACVFFCFRKLQASGMWIERVIVIGVSTTASQLIAEIQRHPELGYRLVGTLRELNDASTLASEASLAQRLDRFIHLHQVDEVVLAVSAESQRDLDVIEILQCCRRNCVTMKLVPAYFGMAVSRVDLEEVNRIPLITVRTAALSAWDEALKRSVDLVLTTTLIVALVPLFLFVALLVKLDSPGPIIYRQTRVGKGERFFQMYKFRSMRQDADKLLPSLIQRNQASGPLFKMRDDPRITRVGKWIRRLSIDELPQLFNVLRGEMSLVGPRPPVPSEVELYEEWQRRRLQCTPGMTGLWQISGRADLTFSDMVQLDLYYIDNWSLRRDVAILLGTVPSVLSTKGAY